MKVLDKFWLILKTIDGLCGNYVEKSSMLAETRRRKLLDRIAQQGFATLDELVKSLGVSDSTVRRDLEMLELSGTIKRTHGGAVFSGESGPLPALEDRASTATLEKQAIGRLTAELIEERQHLKWPRLCSAGRFRW